MAEVPPCVQYESQFDLSKAITVKMDKVENGQKRVKYFTQFTATMGVEGLIYVMDQFIKNATKLNFTTADKWNNFDEVLDPVAESKWTDQITNFAGQSRTEARFKTELDKLVQEHTGSDNPRDVLIQYLKSSSCKKPFSKTPQEHSNRMEVLILIINRLIGTEPKINDANKKKIIFESFRVDWQTDFKKSSNTVANSTLTEIISYMNLCKTVSDGKLENRKKRQRTDRIRGGGGPNNNNNNSNNRNRRQRQTCHLHPNSTHSWDQCSLNPNSENFGRNMRRNNNNFGRGNGNNYSGRGRRNFRGNNNYIGGRDRGDHNNNSNGSRNNYSNHNNNQTKMAEASKT